jgi:hypothetical protein
VGYNRIYIIEFTLFKTVTYATTVIPENAGIQIIGNFPPGGTTPKNKAFTAKRG